MLATLDYVPNSLTRFFEDIVLLQYHNPPKRFVPPFTPLDYILGVCGRSGVLKFNGLIALCEKHKIPYMTTSIDPDNFLDSAKNVYKAVEHVTSLVPDDDDGTEKGFRGIILINNAFYASFKPDNKQAEVLFRDWKTLAEKKRVLIIGLFDYITQRIDDPLANFYGYHFWEQFRQVFYIECPTKFTRISYMKTCLESWASQTGIPIEMSEDDWETMAEHSIFATFTDMDEYLTRLCRAAIYENQKVIHLDYCGRFMQNAGRGEVHISHKKCKQMEEEFHMRFKKSPLGIHSGGSSMATTKTASQFKVPPGYKLVKLEEHEKPKCVITDLAKGFANEDAVKEKLSEKKRSMSPPPQEETLKKRKGDQ